MSKLKILGGKSTVTFIVGIIKQDFAAIPVQTLVEVWGDLLSLDYNDYNLADMIQGKVFGELQTLSQ